MIKLRTTKNESLSDIMKESSLLNTELQRPTGESKSMSHDSTTQRA